VFPKRPLTKSPAIQPRAALAIGGIVVAAALTLPIAAAQAATAPTCPSTTLVQPFVKYGDEGYYWLVSGGSFEGSTAGWTFSAGAKVATGGEPSAVGGSLGKDSLELPVGTAAQSPFTCVEPSDRTFRFFARSEGTTATVLVQLVYQTAVANLVSAGTKLTLKSAWEPSAILHTGAAAATAITGETAHLALRFTATSGTARIDDVYIDPRRR